jgi:hypothetical protein
MYVTAFIIKQVSGMLKLFNTMRAVAQENSKI